MSKVLSKSLPVLCVSPDYFSSNELFDNLWNLKHGEVQGGFSFLVQLSYIKGYLEDVAYDGNTDVEMEKIVEDIEINNCYGIFIVQEDDWGV